MPKSTRELVLAPFPGLMSYQEAVAQAQCPDCVSTVEPHTSDDDGPGVVFAVRHDPMCVHGRKLALQRRKARAKRKADKAKRAAAKRARKAAGQ
ncbi:hypothetical protein ACWEKJ_03510 [Amycolatopsis thermoflava]